LSFINCIVRIMWL